MNIYGLGVYGKKSSRRDCRTTMLRLSLMLLGAAVLTLAAHAQSPAQAPGLTSFTDSLGEHVIYIVATPANTSDVYEKILSPGATTWSFEQRLTAGEPAATGGLLTGFADKSGEHVFFLSEFRHIHRLFLSSTAGSAWIDTDLTASTPNSPGAVDLGLAAFSDSSGEHVFYSDLNGHVHQLYLSSSGSKWIDQDLNVQAGATAAEDSENGSALVAFSDKSGEHVFYFADFGANSHVHQLFYSASGGWIHQDLNVQAKATTNAIRDLVGGGLAGLSLPDSSEEHVFYVGTDFHIHQLYISSAPGSSWNHQDLTALTGGDQAYEVNDTAGALAAYFDSATIAGGGEHVYFVNNSSSNPELCQLNYDDRWTFKNLTKAIGPAGNLPSLRPPTLTGFADTGNSSAHVFYVASSDNHVRQFYYTAASGWAYQDVTNSNLAP